MVIPKQHNTEKFLMKVSLRAIFVGVIASLGLTACNMTLPVYMRHPQTNQTAACGPYNYGPFTAQVVEAREERCITDYQRQGYERAPS